MATRAPRTSRRIALAAAVIAALAHAIAIAIFAWVTIDRRAPRAAADDAAPATASSPPSSSAPADPPPALAAASIVVFSDVDLARLPRAPLPGVGDVNAGDTAPRPRASIDQPGASAADRGGGGPGGPTAWTGRRDRATDVLLRAEPWNGGDAYRSAHDDTRAPPRTTEAIHRAPVATTGDRQAARAGAPGDPQPSRGDATGQGAADQPRAPARLDADPIFDAPAGRTAPARTPGASRASHDPAFAEVGAVAEDVARHGAPGDDRAVAARSDVTRPDPYDLTPSSSGGADHGVRGAPGAGAIADGGHRPGTAATRADVAPGDAGVTVTALAEDPYFRGFLRRLEAAVVFPLDLAKAMRSGRVIARFRLAADGTVHDLRVDVPSEYPGFDNALIAALRQLGTLGPVPRRLLGDADALHVRVPFTFSNPMIR